MSAKCKAFMKLAAILILANEVSSYVVVNRLHFNVSYDVRRTDESSDGITKVSKPDKKSLNFKPIIGILAQEVTVSMNRSIDYKTYIASSYVKFVEAAGARVVPVFIDQPNSYYMNISRKINGFLFPGGALPVDSTSGFGRAGKKIVRIVQRSALNGKEIPLWVTCLGLEMLFYLLTKNDPRQRCQASNFPSSINIRSGYSQSKLLGKAPAHLIYNLSHKNITSNFHHWCITPQSFEEHKLNESFRILSTSLDENGLEYVSTIEHLVMPIYGTQWHPEKSQFEWPTTESHSRIPHSIEAIEASQYLANFFVEQARKNKNRYFSVNEENEAIIHNYMEIYLTARNISNFQQSYFFQ